MNKNQQRARAIVATLFKILVHPVLLFCVSVACMFLGMFLNINLQVLSCAEGAALFFSGIIGVVVFGGWCYEKYDLY